MKSAFDQCSQSVQQSCSSEDIIGNDKSGADSAKQACDAGSKQAGAVAAEKASSGMDMSQLAQMAGQAAQALGSMMQSQQKPTDSAAGTSTDPTSAISDPASSTTADPLVTAVSSTPNAVNPAASGANGATFDGINKNGASASSSTAPTASGATQAGVTAATDPTAASSTDPYNTAQSGGGGAPSGNGASFAGTGGGAGAGSASANTTGASMSPGDAAKPEMAGLEMGLGGGSGGSKPFIGLKSKSNELDPLGDPAAAAAGLDFKNMGNDVGDRSPASTADAGADIHADDGSSLFNVIRTKLVEIKKRGNI